MPATSLPACRNADPELFFPDPDHTDHTVRVKSAKSVCSACPVSSACLGMAILGEETEGIWGGYTTLERRALLRDTHRLGLDVTFAVRQLEGGKRYRVRAENLLPVVHQLSSRGWTVDKLSIALDLTPQAVVKVRQRALAAVACLVAINSAAAHLGIAA